MLQYLSEQQQHEFDNANNIIYQLKHNSKYKTNTKNKYVYYTTELVNLEKKNSNKKEQRVHKVLEEKDHMFYMNVSKICNPEYNTPDMNSMHSNLKNFDEQQLSSLQDMVGKTYKVEKFIEKLQNTTNMYNLHKFSIDELQSLTKAYFTKQRLKRLISAKKRQ